jgi:peptidoglycan biosynthesis protein MviN/MurJ (putative lipid II flippase)
VSKRTDSPGLGSLTSAALTAASTLVVSAFAAIVGIVIAREFGRTDETDGFFAAYGVFIVIALAAQSIRIAVLPALTRARDERRLAGNIAGFATALVVVAVPLVLIVELAADPIAGLLTGDGSDIAQEACANGLRWMVPAAVAHLFAGLAASSLAALDDYATAALGYAAGSAAGLVLILTLVDSEGIVAVGWGMALNGVVALLLPAIVLAWRARRSSMPATAVRPAGLPLASRLGVFAAAAALPIALQLLYVVCLPFAGRLGAGAVTSFGYAYLAAATLVSVTAFSIGLVSSVPLTRIGLGPGVSARHVVSAAWVALTVIGAAVGAFALAGGGIVEGVLGDAYGGDVGQEVARLVVVLSPWMIASVGVNVAFPLAFVAERLRPLPWIGAAALVLQVLLAWAFAGLLDLDGLAIALTLSTFLVLLALLRELDALSDGVRGVAVAAATIAVLTVVAFLPAGLVLGSLPGAMVGLAAYVALMALVRPRGLRASWAYLRALQ